MAKKIEIMDSTKISFIISYSDGRRLGNYSKDQIEVFINDSVGNFDEEFDSEYFKKGNSIQFKGKVYLIEDIQIQFQSLSKKTIANESIRFPQALIEVIIFIEE